MGEINYRAFSDLSPYHYKPCPYCGKVMGDSSDQRAHWTPTRDHLIPTSRGGAKRAAYNLIVCCNQCNWDKDNHTLSEWVDVLRAAGDPRALRVQALIMRGLPSACDDTLERV